MSASPAPPPRTYSERYLHPRGDGAASHSRRAARNSYSIAVGASSAERLRLEPRRLSLHECSRVERLLDAKSSDAADAADASAAAAAADRSRRSSFHQLANARGDSADLTAYYAFSRRRSSVACEEDTGLSGFLEYRKMDGSWRPFLFQTIGYQLFVYRVHITHQVTVMSTDVREATEIALLDEDDPSRLGTTRLLRLGINDTLITLRAVSHHAALYWVEGLRQLQAGHLPRILQDRPTLESEDDIFRQIDQMTYLREWTPPPTDVPLCALCFPCVGRDAAIASKQPSLTPAPTPRSIC
ncbi:hypothetical protein ATCC90586_009879 [Pythium insidiosum]|nr:hypothetical protein ATCC90586_009879 [Pythium insidiosum]